MTQLLIQNNVGYNFSFQAIAPVSNSKIQPAQKIPLPNTEAKNQLLFRFFGQSEELSFDFALFPSSVTLDGGTAPFADFPTGVRTVKEQHEFLRDYIFNSRFNTYWKITFTGDSGAYSEPVFGVVENITIDQPPSSRDQYRTGRLQFTRGKLAGVSQF